MDATLQAVRRETIGKNEAVRLRQSGKIPAVLYGGSSRIGESLSVDPKELSRILHSHAGVNTLIAIKIAGAPVRQQGQIQARKEPKRSRLCARGRASRRGVALCSRPGAGASRHQASQHLA